MTDRETLFNEELEAVGPGIVSLVGGGGKTSLLFALGRAFAESGRAVLCTATTRMLRPNPEAWLAVELRDGIERLSPRTDAPGKALFAARPPGAGDDDAKVYGYAPEDVDAFFLGGAADWILVEADGAARLPLKAPADHEPVVPSRTAVAIAVIGLGVVNRPFSAETVFRPERVSAIAGLAVGDAVTPAAVAKLVFHPAGMFKNVPAGAARLLFCNQSDLPGAEEAADALARELLRACPGFLHGMYAGSLRRKGLRCRMLPTA